MASLPSYHVLNFFHDEEDSSALTILVNETRFHVIANVEKLRGPNTSKDSEPGPWENYFQLLSDLKVAGGEQIDHDSRNQSTDSGIDMEEAESTKDKSEAHPSLSEDAEEKLHEWLLTPVESTLSKATTATGKEESRKRRTLEEWYDCKTLFFSLETKEGQIEAVELEPSSDLQDRMLQLRPSLAPVPKYIREIDIPWYSANDLKLVHCSDSPPPYHPSMVQVKKPASSSDGDGSQTAVEKYFFKAVANEDLQPTKREISLLHQIAKKGLHDKIKCPRLVGIVFQPPSQENEYKSSNSVGSSRRQGPIMGFLQTLIPDPTPLTEKFDSDIPQAKREEWARQAEDMKNILHENGIIWGDAKGDNFVVDEADELWIIDFGGSYTEGWVDPEIVETKKGDDMGVERIVNALQDPEANVARDDSEGNTAADNVKDDEEEKEDDEEKDNVSDQGNEVAGKEKRKRDDDESADENDDDDKKDAKRRKRCSRSSTGADTERGTRYCYCNGLSAGTMIGCDGEDCKKEWFHLECTNLKSLPAEDEEWFCRDCEA